VDLAVFTVSKEDGPLDWPNEEFGVLALVNENLRSVVHQVDLTVSQRVKHEVNSVNVSGVLD
jgi:hypothetical protein